MCLINIHKRWVEPYAGDDRHRFTSADFRFHYIVYVHNTWCHWNISNGKFLLSTHLLHVQKQTQTKCYQFLRQFDCTQHQRMENVCRYSISQSVIQRLFFQWWKSNGNKIRNINIRSSVEKFRTRYPGDSHDFAVKCCTIFHDFNKILWLKIGFAWMHSTFEWTIFNHQFGFFFFPLQICSTLHLDIAQ